MKCLFYGWVCFISVNARVSKKMSTDLRRMSSSAKPEDLTDSSSSESDQEVITALGFIELRIMECFHLRLTRASKKWTKSMGRN